MSVYDQDPDADAVYLYEYNQLFYSIVSTVSRVNDYRARIKILKAEGTDQADVRIVYFTDSGMRESITSLDAAAYNLENGKIVKTPLKKQYIFEEKVDENRSCIKFSIPEVRVGTVIEYRYRLTSPNATIFPSFIYQHDIPVLRSHMVAEIPQFYKVGINLKGHQQIELSEETTTGSIPGQNGNNYSYTNRQITTNAENIPALKREPFVWCLNDFRSMLDFELSQISFPGQFAQNYSTSWESVNSSLAEGSFDTACKIGNPFKDEVAAIKAKDLPAREKAGEVLKLVQSKIKWDGSYRLFSERPRAAATTGSGTSAEINFVLMAALKDAGFKVTPILLCPRSKGRLPYTRATIDGIWNFIVRISLNDTEYAYADATDPNSCLDVLPTEMLVDRARIYGVNGEQGWCDLSRISQGLVTIKMILKLEADGTIQGQILEEHRNQAALTLSTDYTDAQSEEKYIEGIEKEQNILIENFKIEGIGTQSVRQSYDMSYTPNVTDEFAYLNATILPFISSNPLSAQTRKLPIELPEVKTYNIYCTLTLPEGYVVEESPKSIQMGVCEGGMKCRYVSQVAPTNIQLNFIFSTNRLLYAPAQYDDLKTFFSMVVDLNNSQFVIRRANQQ